jgi:hypothetical protein
MTIAITRLDLSAEDLRPPDTSDTHNLRDAMGVVGASLVDPQRQRCFGVPGVDTNDRQFLPLQLMEQPGRGTFAPPNHRSASSKHANRGLLQRHIATDIVVFLWHVRAPQSSQNSNATNSPDLRLPDVPAVFIGAAARSLGKDWPQTTGEAGAFGAIGRISPDYLCMDGVILTSRNFRPDYGATSFFQVCGPTMPSGGIAWLRWNSWTRARVFGPNWPSMFRGAGGTQPPSRDSHAVTDPAALRRV